MTHRPIPPIRPSNYETLHAYALQLTDNQVVSDRILQLSMYDAINVLPENLMAFMRVTVRNKCYDYLRLGESPETIAAELNVPLCRVRPELDAIAQGKFF